MTERLTHLEWTLAQTKGVQTEVLNKLHFIEKRADAMQGNSTDQVRHLYQEVEQALASLSARQSAQPSASQA